MGARVHYGLQLQRRLIGTLNSIHVLTSSYNYIAQSPNLQMPVVSVAIDTTLNLVPVADELTATEVPADKESSCTSAAQRGYTTLASLGSGGFSDVFLVEDQRRTGGVVCSNAERIKAHSQARRQVRLSSPLHPPCIPFLICIYMHRAAAELLTLPVEFSWSDEWK